MCKHESDYTVLYDYRNMKHLMRILLLSAQNARVLTGTRYDQINLKKEFGRKMMVDMKSILIKRKAISPSTKKDNSHMQYSKTDSKESLFTCVGLFSGRGIGCHEFNLNRLKYVTANEIIEKRLKIQKHNNKCEYDSGYILGSLADTNVKNRIYNEIKLWVENKNMSGIDVIVATPPCQGMSAVIRKIWKCSRCGHEWLSRNKEKPLRYTGCKSPYWNREPKRKKWVLVAD